MVTFKRCFPKTPLAYVRNRTFAETAKQTRHTRQANSSHTAVVAQALHLQADDNRPHFLNADARLPSAQCCDVRRRQQIDSAAIFNRFDCHTKLRFAQNPSQRAERRQPLRETRETAGHILVGGQPWKTGGRRVARLGENSGRVRGRRLTGKRWCGSPLKSE